MTDEAGKISVSLFETEVIGTARTFGRHSKVQIIFEGDQAKTNEDTITFPALDHSKPLTSTQVAVGRGYVDHEAAHLRHTDMALFQATGAACQAKGDKLTLQMVNAIEDVRIEKITCAEYPGAMKNLIATTEETAKHFMQTHGTDKEVLGNLKAIGPLAVTWIDRRQRGYTGEYLDKCIESLSPEVRKTVEGWVKVISHVRGVVRREVGGQVIVDGRPGTQDAVALAKRFIGETRAAEKKEPPKPPQPKKAGPNPGDEGEGPKPEVEAPTPMLPGDEPEGEAEIPAPESDGQLVPQTPVELAQDEYAVTSSEEVGTYSGEVSDEAGGIGAGPVKEAWVDDPSYDYSKEPVIDVGLDLGRVFQAQLGPVDGRHVGYRPFSTADDKWHYRKDDPSKYMIDGNSASRARILQTEAGDATYGKVLQEAVGSVSVMKRKLERALLSRAMRGWDTGREDGRLDSRRLALAARGHRNVFKERESVPEIDTAVEVLIDLSGSMNSSKKSYLAMQSAILLCEALDGTGVAYEVTGFNSTTGMSMERRDALRHAHGEGKKFSRTEALDMYIFKHFDETLREGRRAMGNITRCVGGNNADSESVEQAYQRLAKRLEKRHVMLVLSDGYPATGTDYEEHLNTHLRQVVANIEAKPNTQIVGLGIKSEAVKQFYPKWVLVSNIEDLTKHVLDQIGRMLLGERFVVDNSELIGGKKLAVAR